MTEPFKEGFQGSGTHILEEPFSTLIDSMLGGIQAQQKDGKDTNSCQIVFTHPEVDGNLLFTLTLMPGSLHGASVEDIKTAVNQTMNPETGWR